MPAAVHTGEHERIHDLRTSVEAEVPQTATRVVVFYRINNAFITDGDPRRSAGSMAGSRCRSTSRCRS